MSLTPLISGKDSKGKAPIEDKPNRISQSHSNKANRANDARQNYELNRSKQKSFSDYRVNTSSGLLPDEANKSDTHIPLSSRSCSTEESDSTSDSDGDYASKALDDDEESSSEESDQSNSLTKDSWKFINDQLKKNDPFIISLNIKFILTNTELTELSNSLKKNKALGHIFWHADQYSCDTKRQIEARLINNNKNYRHHPNDFVHILLSKHVYKNSRKGDHVKVNPSFDKYLKNWRVETVYDDTKFSGYYAVIYQNTTTHQVVLAIRGTEGGAVGVLKSLLSKNSDWKTNLEEILGGQVIIGQQARNHQATCEAIEIAKKKKYRLSFTGHSLGAWLAELSVFYSHAYFKHYNVKAVTFESPGALPMMDKLQSNILNRDTQVKLKNLNIITYLATPNPINCCNSHVGAVHCVEVDMEWTDYSEDKVPDLISDKIQGILAIEGHGLSKMLNEFDPRTGRPRKCDKMDDWPRMEYNGEEKDFASNAIDLMRMGIEKGVDWIPFESSILSTLASKTIGTAANWLIGDKTIMTIIGFLKSVITGEVDQEQYWEYFKHINLQGSDTDTSRKKIKQNFDHRFALAAKAHFRKEEGNHYIMSLKPGSSDKFLFNLYRNKKSLEQRKDLPQPLRKQLMELLSAFTIEALYDGKYQLVPKGGHDAEHIKQNIQRLFQVFPMDRFQLSCKVIYISSKRSISSNSKEKRDIQTEGNPPRKNPLRSPMSPGLPVVKPKNSNSFSRSASAPVKHNPIFSPMLPPQPPKNTIIPKKANIVSNVSPPPRLAGKKVNVSINNLSSPNYTRTSSSVIYLEIKNPKELQQFQTLLLNPMNKPLFDKIEGLELSGLKIDKNTIDPFHIFLASLVQNIKLFPNFTSLSIGNIDQHIKLKLPQSLSHLTSLSIGRIHSWASITLPTKFDHLTDFSVGSIDYNNIKLLNNLNNLNNLTIGYMHGSITQRLPNSLNNLITLTIRHLGPGVTLKFPDSLNCLRNFFIGDIPSLCDIDMTCRLDKLENLSIGNINGQVIFRLYNKLKKLKHFSVGFISSYYTAFSLPNKLDDLTHLSIIDTVRLGLPQRLDNLTELRIRDIWNCSKKDLPDSLPNLRSLILTTVSCKSVDRFASLSSFLGVGQNTVDLPRSFRSVTTLYINNIENNAIFEVPAVFTKLTSIIIENIGENATLILPNLLKNLKTLSINCIGKNATLKVPSSFPKHTNFIVKRILSRANLNTAWSLDSQIAKAMKTIWKNAVIKSTRIGSSDLQPKDIIDENGSESSSELVDQTDYVTNLKNIMDSESSSELVIKPT